MFCGFRVGDSVVHMLGGIAGGIGAWVVGPRYGRYDKKYAGMFEPHNLTFMTLGTMILWTGWYGFNAGSTQALTGSQALVSARVAINTTIAGSVGSIVGMVIGKIFLKQYHLPSALNGCLAGLVAITGPCAVVEPWTAVIAGATAPFIYYFSARLMEKLKIDDPIEATCVHFFCGFWGLIRTFSHYCCCISALFEADF
jgi:Amt family ammonium transporter